MSENVQVLPKTDQMLIDRYFADSKQFTELMASCRRSIRLGWRRGRKQVTVDSCQSMEDALEAMELLEALYDRYAPDWPPR